MAIKCPGCGKDSEDIARFCNSCGATIASTEPTTGMPSGIPPVPPAAPPGPYGQPTYYQPPPKKSRVWLWVTLSVISGLIVLFLIPVFFSSQSSHPGSGACRDNLRTIDSAIMQYAAANGGIYPDGTSDLVGTYVRAPFPTCKSSKTPGVYTYSNEGTNAMRAVCPNGHTY